EDLGLALLGVARRLQLRNRAAQHRDTGVPAVLVDRLARDVDVLEPRVVTRKGSRALICALRVRDLGTEGLGVRAAVVEPDLVRLALAVGRQRGLDDHLALGAALGDHGDARRAARRRL